MTRRAESWRSAPGRGRFHPPYAARFSIGTTAAASRGVTAASPRVTTSAIGRRVGRPRLETSPCSAGGTIALSAVNVDLDGNVAEGVLTFATDGRQTLQGTLAADELDLHISGTHIFDAAQSPTELRPFSHLIRRFAGEDKSPPSTTHGRRSEASSLPLSTPAENLTDPPGENLTDRRGDEPQDVPTS